MKLEDIANVYIGVVLKRKEAVYKGTKTNKYKVFNIRCYEENIEYDEYIKRIKNNSIACKVKIADLTHNLDKTRLDFVTEVDVKRNEKYKKALQILYY